MRAPVTYYKTFLSDDVYYWNYRYLRLEELGRWMGPSVLDIGAGSGGDMAYVRDVLGRKVATYDANPVARDLLRDAGFTVFDSLDQITERYDTIFFSHVIEHVSPGHIYEHFETMVRLLKDDGNLLIISPVGRAIWDSPDHYRMYDRAPIETLLRRFGLRTEFLRYAGSQNVLGRLLRPVRRRVFTTPRLLRWFYRLSDISRRELLVSGRKQGAG